VIFLIFAFYFAPKFGANWKKSCEKERGIKTIIKRQRKKVLNVLRAQERQQKGGKMGRGEVNKK